MSDMLTQIVNGRGFTAPVRNRYFYGKLLDAHHLEMEQRYFLEMGRLINRLTLGSGVLCGLQVKPGTDSGTVVVSPGVAVDGHGREIVVSEQVALELAKLERDAGDEEDAGDGTPIHLRGQVLCLSYHECDVEPAPVLVADCDVRQHCVPGVVRERYKFTLMPAAEAPLPRTPCSILRGYRPIDPATIADSPRVIERALAANLEHLGEIGNRPAETRPGSAGALRERLCAVFDPPCAPGSDCVPVALVEEDEGGMAVDECLPRRTIYSNAVLLDLILCLAEHVEECCQRKVVVTAPKVVDMWPSPAARATPPQTEATPTEVKLTEFGQLQLQGDGIGIAVSFDRAMNDERLAQPGDWIRAMVMPPEPDAGGGADDHVNVLVPGGGTGTRWPLVLDHKKPKTLSGGEGQTAYYRFDDLAIGARTLTFRDAIAGAGSAWVIVLMRSDDVTQIAAADGAELLDADFHGTGLTGEAFDLIWVLSALTAISAPLVRAAVTPPAPMPVLPSGNGIEGGVFHSAFHITG